MSVLKKVILYQKKIERNRVHSEILIHCINRLHKLPITVWHLEKTGIGKTINGLRKFQGDVGNAVKALVWKWKRMVFVETAAEEHAKKEKGLKNPTVINSDEIALNDVNTEEKEVPTHINCDILHQSTKGGNKVHLPKENKSHVFAVNQSSTKTDKQKCSHHPRSSKRHTRNRRDKAKHSRKGKAADSELRIKEDSVKIKLEKVHTVNDNGQEEKRLIRSGSCSIDNHCSKQVENETKYYRKERGQKRKTGLIEECRENMPEQTKSSVKFKDKILYDGNVDYFAEALRMGDATKNKTSSSTTSNIIHNSYSKSSPGTKTNIPFNYIPEIVPIKLDRCLMDTKIEYLNVETDIATQLPHVSPNYNTLSHLPLMETLAIKHAARKVPLSKQHRQRMKVYSGVKTGRPIPTLYDLSVRVLEKHIGALEYTGGVPYDILKPILKHATPEQLFQVEYYNPYLIKDTNELWELHCRKEFCFGQLQPMETAREMYLRCLDEREAKLKALTCSIQQSLTKTSPIRKTKLTYVDSDPKPPRNVAKEQAKYGTGSISKCDSGKSQRNTFALMPLTSTATLNYLKKSINSINHKKPHLAPLMQKTMKLAKSFKR